MKFVPAPFSFARTFSSVCIVLALAQSLAHADWKRDETTLAWQKDGKTVWRFSFDPKKGKPFFDPVTVDAGPSLTNFRPEDHPWHYGLWFSWKYINHVNYWEEERKSGQSQGKTQWSAPEIETKPDGAATIKLAVTYTNPSGEVMVTEARDIRVSAPTTEGNYTIDWSAKFTAGKEALTLDRTPMLGEPNGAVNGGYAGLSIRMANAPLEIAFLSTAGAVPDFVKDRSRPALPAVASNFTENGQPIGGVAMLSDPANAGENAPWYLINSSTMRFMCAAILAPKPRTVEAGAQFPLRYRVSFRKAPWTAETLQASYKEWLGASK